MATVNLYFGAGGTAGGAATSFATRTSSLTQLKSVMLANVTSADDVVLWGEGLITRETHTSWGVVSGVQFGITDTECVGKSLRLRSYSVLGGPETPLTITDFYRYKNGGSTADWTDTGTTTTRGTKIWKTTTILNSGALNIGTNGMGRVFAADFTTDPKFTVKELWEGGNNYNSTLGAAIHQNLDIIPGTDVPGSCWTLYNAAGALDTYLYIACPVNPFTAFGVITLSPRGSSSILGFTNIQGLVVDPEVTTRGGGVYGGLSLSGCGTLTTPAIVEPRILNTNRYGTPLIFRGTAFANVVCAPYIDPEYKSITPYYTGGTAHVAGGNEASIYSGTNLTSATGWPENGGVPSVLFKAVASNGRASRICDLEHAGIASFPLVTTGQFVRIEDGIEFDFSHVKYGRAFAFGNFGLVDVGAIRSKAQPTQAQYTGGANGRFRLRGARFESVDNIGSVTSPWGESSFKLGTSAGFASYSKTGYPTGELLIEDCMFECQDGGISLQTYDSVSFGGKVRIMNSVFIRPSLLSNIPNLGTRVNNGVLLYIATHSAAALPDQIELINNVAIGFGATPCPYINTEVSPSFVYLEPEDIPCSVNTGWTKFATYDEFRQALSSGQLPHIKA